MKRITIQGIAGCFHETAAHGSFPGEEVEVLPCVSFDEQFARMAADAELLGVAAIENTIAGSLLPNHELLRRSTLTVIGENKLRISHVLAALPGQQIAEAPAKSPASGSPAQRTSAAPKPRNSTDSKSSNAASRPTSTTSPVFWYWPTAAARRSSPIRPAPTKRLWYSRCPTRRGASRKC